MNGTFDRTEGCQGSEEEKEKAAKGFGRNRMKMNGTVDRTESCQGSEEEKKKEVKGMLSLLPIGY
jgi:hypothetical protein